MFGNISAFQIDSGRIYFAKGKTRFSSIEFLAFDTADYNEKDPASLIRALSDIASKHDITGSKMVTTLPAHNIIMKNFSFPFSDKSMIDEVVLLEAEENIPVEIDTLYHSHQILHKSS